METYNEGCGQLELTLGGRVSSTDQLPHHGAIGAEEEYSECNSGGAVRRWVKKEVALLGQRSRVSRSSVSQREILGTSEILLRASLFVNQTCWQETSENCLFSESDIFYQLICGRYSGLAEKNTADTVLLDQV
eukprot:s4156_g10.t1